MNGYNVLFGGAAVAAISASWSYLRWLWSYVCSFVLVTYRVDGELSPMIAAHFNAIGKRTPYGIKRFGAYRFIMRQTGMLSPQAYERLSAGTLFFVGWRPFWLSQFSAAASTNDNEPTIRFIRGTFDMHQLLKDAMIREAERTNGQSLSLSRYFVETLTGRPKELGRPQTEPSNAPVTSRGVDISRCSPNPDWRMITCEPQDIGLSTESLPTIDFLALDEHATNFVSLVGRWAAKRHWYQSHRVPWRLGARFVGPPGNGKTSLVRGLAMKYDMPIFVLDLSTMDNRDLRDAWNRARRDSPAIVLIEDIHAVFHGDQPVNEESELTFDSLLQCLSGVDEAGGMLTIVTTNKPELLDPALTRPGRLDVEVVMLAPSEEGRRKIVERILGDWPDAVEQVIAETDGKSGAETQDVAVQLALKLSFEMLLNDNDADQEPGRVGVVLSRSNTIPFTAGIAKSG